MPKPFAQATTAFVVAVLLSAGCGAKLDKPPIECSYRPSLVGAGKILRLENRSNEVLREVRVEIRAGDDDVTYEQAEIGGYQVLEVGWKKLGGFEIPDDATIEIRAKGYWLPLRVELVPDDDNPRSESQ